MPDDDDLIEVGHILSAHGVRGQVRVFSNTSPRENIVQYSPWTIKNVAGEKTLEVTGKRQGKNVIATIESVSDRNQAEELIGARVLIQKSQLPELKDGEYYWNQLIGLRVRSTEGSDFGVVDQMMETGANDVMVVQGDRERLIPFVMDEIIKSVDLELQQITVDWDAEF